MSLLGAEHKIDIVAARAKAAMGQVRSDAKGRIRRCGTLEAVDDVVSWARKRLGEIQAQAVAEINLC